MRGSGAGSAVNSAARERAMWRTGRAAGTRRKGGGKGGGKDGGMRGEDLAGARLGARLERGRQRGHNGGRRGGQPEGRPGGRCGRAISSFVQEGSPRGGESGRGDNGNSSGGTNQQGTEPNKVHTTTRGAVLFPSIDPMTATGSLWEEPYEINKPEIWRSIAPYIRLRQVTIQGGKTVREIDLKIFDGCVEVIYIIKWILGNFFFYILTG